MTPNIILFNLPQLERVKKNNKPENETDGDKNIAFLTHKPPYWRHGLIWPVSLFTLPWMQLASFPQTGGLLLWHDPAEINCLDGQEERRI